MPDPTCPHLAPIGGWCRLGTNFKCPAKPNRVDCPYPNVGSLDQRSSDRHARVTSPDRANVFEVLAEPFAPNEILWSVERVSRDRRRALVRATIATHTILERLDAGVGTAAWTDAYDITPAEQAGTQTRVQCSLSILGVTKQDVIEGDLSRQTTRELVKAALRQTAMKFGIGRYLEKLEGVWVDYDDERGEPLETPTLPAWAVPRPDHTRDARVLRFNPPMRSETFTISRTPATTPHPTGEAATSRLPATDGTALLTDLIHSLRELPGGEAALRRLIRGNDWARRTPEDKRRLYAELRRAHRELSSGPSTSKQSA
jgi:hypothetical protein